MAIGSVIEARRSLLHGALSLLGMATSAAQQDRTREQVAQASRFVDARFREHGDVVAGPISLLQREYHLGYPAALELAAKLEAAQIWSVYRDGAGMRCARRLGRA